MLDFDIIIVGAGLVGASLAAALRGSAFKLAVIESHAVPPPPACGEWDSRIYAISPGSADFLARCGVWDRLDHERIEQVTDMEVYGDDGKSRLAFSAYESGVAELCHIVEGRALADALWRVLEEHESAQLLRPARCASLAFGADDAELRMENSEALRARLIVGADGADSWVRQAAGIEVDTRPYRQSAVVANFDSAHPHRGVARQWFRSDGVLALLPLAGQRVSMVWSTDEEHALELLKCAAGELCALVAEAAGGKTGELQLITPARAFALRAQKLAHCVAPRLALIGDAAHNVHPLAGQGVNLGFQDARELAAVLARREARIDCGDLALLRRYQRARRESVLTMQVATDSLHALFGSRNATVAWLRNTGLAATGRLPNLKHLLVKQALA